MGLNITFRGKLCGWSRVCGDTGKFAIFHIALAVEEKKDTQATMEKSRWPQRLLRFVRKRGRMIYRRQRKRYFSPFPVVAVVNVVFI
jgi:hypothetical protein